jgi:outer membrane protein OmpA-like peptidoglycan-associated protein
VKYCFTILLFLFTTIYFAQKKQDYSVCAGKIQISANNPYTMTFMGKKGLDKNKLHGYLNDIEVPKNAIWTAFEPGKNGKMQLKCKSDIGSFHLVIFKTAVGGGCLELGLKRAEPIFIKTKADCRQMENVNLDLVQGFEYVVVFIAEPKSKKSINFELNFQPMDEKGKDYVDTLTMNLIYDKARPIYSFHVIDEVSGKPVTARISISSQSEIDGTYFASDLFLNLTRTLKNATIKFDAEGYNSKDLKEYKLASSSHKKDTVKLTPFVRGTISKLDEIYFSPGLAQILDDSYPRLLRLRDFLVLNPQISIEIQGHVNEDRKHGLFSNRLSKKRAERIKEFLIESGISSQRLNAVGFGNSKPIFEKPENEAQKEANRRVEILIR